MRMAPRMIPMIAMSRVPVLRLTQIQHDRRNTILSEKKLFYIIKCIIMSHIFILIIIYQILWMFII